MSLAKEAVSEDLARSVAHRRGVSMRDAHQVYRHKMRNPDSVHASPESVETLKATYDRFAGKAIRAEQHANTISFPREAQRTMAANRAATNAKRLKIVGGAAAVAGATALVGYGVHKYLKGRKQRKEGASLAKEGAAAAQPVPSAQTQGTQGVVENPYAPVLLAALRAKVPDQGGVTQMLRELLFGMPPKPKANPLVKPGTFAASPYGYRREGAMAAMGDIGHARFM